MKNYYIYILASNWNDLFHDIEGTDELLSPDFNIGNYNNEYHKLNVPGFPLPPALLLLLTLKYRQQAAGNDKTRFKSFHTTLFLLTYASGHPL